jgi:hypothetical protein
MLTYPSISELFEAIKSKQDLSVFDFVYMSASAREAACDL